MFHHFSVGCCHGSVVTEVLSRMCCHRSVTHRTETCPQHRSQGKFCTALQLFTSFSRQVLYSVTATYRNTTLQLFTVVHICTVLLHVRIFTKLQLSALRLFTMALLLSALQHVQFFTGLQLFTAYTALYRLQPFTAVSYTHLTLPTNHRV